MTYRQPVCGTIWNDGWSNKRLEITHCHNAQRHLHQSEYWILCLSSATRKCTGWRNVLFRICRSTGRHFKRSVNTLMVIYAFAIENVFMKKVLVVLIKLVFSKLIHNNWISFSCNGHNLHVCCFIKLVNHSVQIIILCRTQYDF